MSAPPYIDLWLLDFEPPSGSEAVDTPPPWMQDKDIARLEAMGHPRRRAEFLLGRRLLRHALRARFGSAALAWRLQNEDRGRPFLRSDEEAALPAVSLSHSRTLIACAIGSPPRLGLDVESLGRRANFESLASTVFHPLEHVAMCAADTQAEEHFLRCWTMKEALAKALGLGLAMPMKQYAFVDDRLAAAPYEFDAGAWRFHRPAYRDDVKIALAWEATTREEATLSLHRLDRRELDEE